jgi:hypothetical protein
VGALTLGLVGGSAAALFGLAAMMVLVQACGARPSA